MIIPDKSIGVTAAEIYADGFAVCEHNITNDRFTFRFRDEIFDFKNTAAVRCQASSFVRDKAPYIRVIPVDRLRELAIKYPEDRK